MVGPAKILALAAAVAAAGCWAIVLVAMRRGRRPERMFIAASLLTGVSFFAMAASLP